MPNPTSFLVDVLRLCLWLAILSAIFVPLERIFALHRRSVFRAGFWEDVGFYFLSSLLPALVLSLPLALVVRASHAVIPEGYYAWIDGLPLWLRLLATFVVGDFGFYWGHRWSHELPLLWRFHRVHHRPAEIDWLMSPRAHPFDLLVDRLCGLVPIYLLGLAGRGAGEGNLAAILFVLAGTIWGFFIHANIRWRLGPLEHLLSSPFFHHWHHSREAPINRNYASMLPIFDRLFGTLHRPRVWPASYGVDEAAEGDAQPIAASPIKNAAGR